MSTNTKRHKRGRERERENSIENHAKKRRGKLVSLWTLFCACLVVLEMSRKFRCISAPQHTTRTRHSLEKRTFARGNTFRTTRTVPLASLFLPASSIQTRFIWISPIFVQKGEETRAKKCEFQSRPFARAQTHATRTIKTNSRLRTFSRPSTFVFKTRKMCWKSSPTIKAMMVR